MEEELCENQKLIIRLDSLYEILTNFFTIAKIRYNKDSDLLNISIDDENKNNKNTNNIFDFFKSNLEDNENHNYNNLFKKEYNIFHIDNNSKSFFNSEFYYYNSIQSISQIEVNKKMKEFFLFLDKYIENFKNNLYELIKDETLYYNHYSNKSSNIPKKSIHKENKINENFLKIINNNISINNNKDKLNEKKTKRVFFIYDETHNESTIGLKGQTNSCSFYEFIRNQKIKKSCFDFISKNIEDFKNNCLKVFVTFKSKSQFKDFFFEFLKNQNFQNINNKKDFDKNESISVDYNINSTKIDYINLDFLRLLQILWTLLRTISTNDIKEQTTLEESMNHRAVPTNDKKIKYSLNDFDSINKFSIKNKLIEIFKQKKNNEYFIISGNNKAFNVYFPRSLIILITLELDEQIFLGFFKISKRHYLIDDFVLHKAIYENNIKKINDLCKNESNDNLFCDLNEIDHEGNSPLMLAIKLNRLDAISVLCDNNAEIKHLSYNDSISPYDYAIIDKNINVLKILINAFKKQKLTFWHRNQKDLAEIIKLIPDFSMEFTVSLNSTIFSVIKSITPKDVFKISKKGSNIRIDMNISSLNTALKTFKGKSSFIISEFVDTITIKKLDFQKKILYDYIDSITEIKDDENKLQELISEGWKSKKLNNIDLKILQQNNKKKEEKVLGFDSQSMTGKGMFIWLKRKVIKKKVEELCAKEKKKFSELKNFEEYSKIQNNEFIDYCIDKEYKFFEEKYKRILNGLEKYYYSKQDNPLTNEDNHPKNASSQICYKGLMNNNTKKEMETKIINPLLFSFENRENTVICQSNQPLVEPSSKQEYHHHEKLYNFFNEKEFLILNLITTYSSNPEISKFIENYLAQKGYEKNLFEETVSSPNSSNNNIYTQINSIIQTPIKFNHNQEKFNFSKSKKSNIYHGTLNFDCNNLNKKKNIIKNLQSNNNDIKFRIISTKNPSNKNLKNINFKKGMELHLQNVNNNFSNLNSSKNLNNNLNNNALIHKNQINIDNSCKESLVEKKISQKEISLNLLTSKDFPIKIFHFIPLIHILSFTSSEFSLLNTILCNKFLPFDTFPMKIEFPIGLSLAASLSITEFTSNMIQEISLDDFQKEGIVDIQQKNNNIINFKDISSNANHSTALLDDKYAKEFYDKYFQEKNIDAFSEFSEECYNKDNFLRGSKTNYSELFRDEEYTDNQVQNGGKNCNFERENQKSFENSKYILTELKNSEKENYFNNNYEKESVINLVNCQENQFYNLNKNFTNAIDFNVKNNNNEKDFNSKYKSTFEREFSKDKKYNTINTKENSIPKKNYSIATNDYKNKKIAMKTFIRSNSNSNSRPNTNKHSQQENIEDFFKNKVIPNKITNVYCNLNTHIQHTKKNEKTYIQNNENRFIFNRKINISEISNSNNTKLENLYQENSKEQNSFNDISDFEKTIEENASLNISKYTQDLKYKKPPDFRQKVKKFLKASDFNSQLKIPPLYQKIENSFNTNKVDLAESDKGQFDLQDFSSNKINKNFNNSRNTINMNFIYNSNLLYSHSHISSTKNNMFQTMKHYNNYNKNNLNKNINYTMDFEYNKEIKIEKDFDKTIDKNKISNHNIDRNNENRSIYIPAEEFNNFYIPTYSNADNNDFDRNSCLDKTIFYNIRNKTYTNFSTLFKTNNIKDCDNNYLNYENFKHGNPNMETIELSDNLINYNINKHSNKINYFNKTTNSLINNEFAYNSINTENSNLNLNFDSISLCVKNENYSENQNFNHTKNLTLNSRLGKLNNYKNDNSFFIHPGKAIKLITENNTNKNFNTINIINKSEINYNMNNSETPMSYFDNQIDLLENTHEENIPLEKTVYNKINNLKILPIKFIKNNNNNSLHKKKLGLEYEKLNDRKNLNKKKINIPKYVKKTEK